jgi:hypothetical protein
MGQKTSRDFPDEQMLIEMVRRNDLDGMEEFLLNLTKIEPCLNRLVEHCVSLEMMDLLVDTVNRIKTPQVPYTVYSFRNCPVQILKSHLRRTGDNPTAIFISQEFDHVRMRMYIYLSELNGDINARIPHLNNTLLGYFMHKHIHENTSHRRVEDRAITHIQYLLARHADPYSLNGSYLIDEIQNYQPNIGDSNTDKLERVLFLTILILKHTWKYSNNEELARLRRELDTMKMKYESLQERLDAIYYAPGMPGEMEAKSSFDKSRSRLEMKEITKEITRKEN